MKTREMLPILRWLRSSFSELGLEDVPDPRADRGKRWKLPTLLKTTLLSMIVGRRGLGDTERLTEKLGSAVRRCLGLSRRLPDTTLRDALCKLTDIEALRGILHRAVRFAARRRALEPVGLPISVAAMDGKVTRLTCWDTPWIQRVQPEDGVPYGLMRTVTTTLVTARGQPCIDVNPIAQHTNEMGYFKKAFGDLVRAHGRLFTLVTYDAGADSETNAAAVVKACKHYLFHIAQENWHMTQLIRELLAHKTPYIAAAEKTGPHTELIRKLRVIAVNDLSKAAHKTLLWAHTRTILQVDTETWKTDSKGKRHLITTESKVFCTSYPLHALTQEQWLKLIRLHWGVELTHQTLDVAFAEDKRPWIVNDGHGAVATAILRRVAYTLLTLFRSITRRLDKRDQPWAHLMEDIHHAVVVAKSAVLATLAPRKLAASS